MDDVKQLSMTTAYELAVRVFKIIEVLGINLCEVLHLVEEVL